MDSILRLRSYGIAIAANTNAKGVIDWHRNELLYGYVQFSITLLRTMVHEIIYAARMQLLRKMLLLNVNDEGQSAAGATAIPFIRWNQLVNNAAERRTGWHFVNDPRNQEAFGHINGGIWLARRVHQKMRLQQRFFYSNERWRMDKMHAYEEEIKIFWRDVMPLVHMNNGQPARGTEFVTI
jgi:hypothetical protein